MIKAKIIEISDKVIVEWPLLWNSSEEVANYFCEFENGFNKEHFKTLLLNAINDLIFFKINKSSRQTAEVDNVCNPCNPTGLCTIICDEYFDKSELELNQLCYIEPISSGKCKIVKL